MNKKYLIGGVIFLVLLIISFFIVKYELDRKNSDAYRFKEEYESLNNTVRESDGATYNNLTIDSENPIKYVSVKEAIEVLDKEQAILYVGANWCPWCRNAVPVLLDVAKKYNIDTIYYLNLDNDKSTYEVEDKKLKETKHGTAEYYELLEKLDSVLKEYTIEGTDGKKYKTGEKRIYMPFVIAIKDAKIVATHEGTVDLNKNQTKYDAMTDEQRLKLTDIYSDMFVKVFMEEYNKCNNKVCE